MPNCSRSLTMAYSTVLYRAITFLQKLSSILSFWQSFIGQLIEISQLLHYLKKSTSPCTLQTSGKYAPAYA